MKNIDIDFKPEDFSRRKFINYAMAAGIAIPALSAIPALNCAHGGVFQRPKDLENFQWNCHEPDCDFHSKIA